MKFILVRHGETVENKKGIIQGHLCGRLSKEGKNQSKILAKKLQDEKIDYIYSSDLKRAIDTAEILNTFHSLEIFKSKNLREFDFGLLSGTLKKDLKSFNNSEIETTKSVDKRVSSFLSSNIIRKPLNSTILIISHGGIQKMLISKLSKTLTDKNWRLSNASITIIEDGEIKIFNCTKHFKNKTIQTL